jgi:hypothetical protein
MRWVAVVLMGLAVGLAGCAQASPPQVSISDAWARPTVFADQASDIDRAAAGGTGAAYLTLTNGGGSADVLVSASSPVSARTELHETRVEGDVASMHQHGAGVTIPADGEVIFEPLGSHVMLIDLQQPLVEGETFELTLRFQSGLELVVPVAVEAR